MHADVEATHGVRPAAQSLMVERDSRDPGDLRIGATGLDKAEHRRNTLGWVHSSSLLRSSIPSTRPSEGIGRPEGLKSLCPKGRAGSNPASGTNGGSRRDSSEQVFGARRA